MGLFKLGNFVSHSGVNLEWKIECDVLDDEDYECLAKIASDRYEFGSVYGIPRGGVKFAKALEKYVTNNSIFRLVVDDVWTTGNSLLNELNNENDFGLVIFARNDSYICQDKDVYALFTMHNY